MSKFLKFIVNTVVICVILVAGALLIPPLAKVNTIMVDDANMDTNLPLGSVTYSKSIGVADVGVGDKIIFKENAKTYEYQVKDMDATAKTYTVVDTKDSTAQEKTITLNKTILKPIFTIPFIAYTAMALQTTEGLIMVGLGVVFLVILFILSELWKKDKEEDYSEDDSEEDDDEPKSNLQTESKKESIDEAQPEEAKSELDIASESLMQESMRGVAQEVQQAKTEATEATESALAEEEPAEIEQVKTELRETEPVKAEPVKAEPVEEIPIELNATEEVPEVPEVPEEAELAEKPTIEEVLEEAVPEQPVETLEEQLEKILSAPTAEELIAKAKAAGSEPTILEDKDAKVTLLDYSDIL